MKEYIVYRVYNSGSNVFRMKTFNVLITDGKEYLYFNTGDYRWHILGKEWFNDILIRRADNENDYIGGTNCTCKLCDIGETAARILN